MPTGHIAAIYRYPVKSMAGESITQVTLSSAGLPGDRAWAVRDEVRGGIRGAKKLPGLMQLSARYPKEPADSGSSPAEIALPDGATFQIWAPEAYEAYEVEATERAKEQAAKFELQRRDMMQAGE